MKIISDPAEHPGFLLRPSQGIFLAFSRTARTLPARHFTARNKESLRAPAKQGFSQPSMARSLIDRRQNPSRACFWKCAAKIWSPPERWGVEAQ
jgi:hypothetical protein